jgi:hypothetical protein
VVFILRHYRLELDILKTKEIIEYTGKYLKDGNEKYSEFVEVEVVFVVYCGDDNMLDTFST